MNGIRFTLAIAAAAGLVMAGGTHSGGVRASMPSRAPAALLPCSMVNLDVVISWHKVGVGLPGGGGIEGSTRFTKKGTGSCTLSGWPRVRVFDAQQHRLTIAQRNLPAPPDGLPTVTLNSTVYPKQRASATIAWGNWCKSAASRPLSVGIRLPRERAFRRVSLKSGARLLASCVNPTAASVLTVGSMAPAQ